MISRLTFLLFAALFSTVAFAQTEVTITDADLVGNTTYNWTSDNTYILDGLVYLEEGGRLNIEAGTVIRGITNEDISTGDETSALIITRGAQIFAEGTADEPIIFTAEDDVISDPDDFTSADRGEWGGLIVLGNATIARPGGEDGIEGIDSGEPRARFGGGMDPDDADNSGVLKYISIRHGGSQLSTDNEINGLTLGGVGSGTEIDYVEVFANLDDGIEWFGGTVSVKHASVAFCGDDGFDYDFGWRGKGQFWFAIQEPGTGTGRSGEHDGANPDGQAPFSQPTIYNATYIGIGNGATATGGDANRAIPLSVLMRDNAGGFYNNSIFTGFNGAAIAVEDRDDTDVDAFARFEAGDLAYNDNIFEDFGAGTAADDLFLAVDQGEAEVAASTATFSAAMAMDNTIGTTGIAGISRLPNGGLDPRIDAGGAALGGATPSDDPFFNLVSYRGAFGNRVNWLEGWTALSDNGYLGDIVDPVNTNECIVITDADLVGGQTYNWTSNNCYTLDGLVFLEADGVLNIEQGTVIRGLNADNISTGDNTSALIIARDAQIFARGTADEPIIFTAAEDDLNDDGDFTSADRGEWGGLIILGNATIARPGGEDGIEGIDSGEPRARFGGTTDDDNSGVLNYVSIRHGGAQLATDNEINGLTLGGVGSGTEIDYVEVFANLDDGIEWFGGTVSVKHASVAFCGDDGFDYDFGWRGKGQFWFAIQEPGTGTGRSGEHDGANPDGQAPFSQPTIYNATYIGIGNGATATGGDANRAIPLSVLMRDNAGGFYNNSIFTGFNGSAIAIEDRDDTDVDAFARFEAGDLAYSDNIFEDFGAGTAADDLFLAVDQGENEVAASTATFSAAMAMDNTIGTTGIAGISRMPDGGLDPRINSGGAALGGGTPSDDPFFNLVTYRGAFGNRVNWLEGWTALSDLGYLGDVVTPVNDNDCIVVTDADLVGGQTYNWGGGNCYTLDGLVYLEADGILNIEQGTVIRGLNADDISTGDNTSALIITRDAQIFARGTAQEPIIFTAAEDDLNDDGDFTSADRGEWGGLIILGNATIARPGGEDGIEGIDSGEPRARFGGTTDDDNSGVLNYVSIRHGGAQLATDNEINGLTLGGVGSGTEIDYVEVFANLDDGIEWFGGTVSVKHASVAFCGDDGFDYDFGWRGKGQFWFAIQEPGTGTGRSGEHDGANPDGQAPFSQPTIYNATYIGIGNGATATGGDANRAIPLSVLMRDNAGGFYNNSIFTGFNGAAIAVEDRDDTDVDAFARFEAGDLAYNDNIFEDFGAGTAADDLFLALDQGENEVAASTATFSAAMAMDNTIGTTGIAGISRMPDGGLDPRINSGGAALGGATPSDDPFFNLVSYRGAFGNTVNWLEDWTALSDLGYLGDIVSPVNTNDCIVVTDADLVGGQTYNWGSGNCYTLDGLVYLEADGVLNIEAGTVIRGLGADDISTGDNTSALIITRDAQIFARGTAQEPVIFTAAEDDINDPDDFTSADRGEWGGLIILGNATIARPGGEDGIEGIDSGEPRARFGGTADDDNSGVLNYVSIRHGGAQLATDNEINGLTLGGVGSGTEIDYVEVFANLDDGIEWFGGTVVVDHAAVAFCGDDGFDYDFGWRGGGQFWYALQGPGSSTGRSGEHDGANPDGQAPFSQPTIYNATYVGIGNGQTATGGDANRALPLSILFRDNAGGFYRNSVFTDFNGAAIAIEDRDDTDVDAFARYEAGDLALEDNIFFNFGAGTDAADLFVAVDQGENIVASSSATVAAGMSSANNRIIDPVLIDMDRDSEGGALDPRPNEFGPAAFGAPAAVTGFESVPYYGAFAPGENGGVDGANWLNDWTALTTTMIVNDELTSVGEVEQNGFLLDAPVPNPTSGITKVTFTLPRTAQVSITVVDMLGRPIARRVQQYSAGEQNEFINASDLPNGTYLIVLDAEGSRLLQKMVVNR